MSTLQEVPPCLSRPGEPQPPRSKKWQTFVLFKSSINHFFPAAWHSLDAVALVTPSTGNNESNAFSKKKGIFVLYNNKYLGSKSNNSTSTILCCSTAHWHPSFSAIRAGFIDLLQCKKAVQLGKMRPSAGATESASCSFSSHVTLPVAKNILHL